MDNKQKDKISLVRGELKLKVLSTIFTFESKEVSEYGNITDEDIINVLSSIIAKRTEK
jgi:uncharacterized protein YqeY